MRTVNPVASNRGALVVRRLLGPAALREEVRAAADRETVDQALTVLTHQRLMGTGGARLLERFGDLLDDNQRAAIEGAFAATSDRAHLAEFVVADILHRLRAAGIAAVPLKGPVLARRILGDANRRAFSDLDFLVDAGRLHDAVAVVEAAGWQRGADPVDRDGRPLLHFSLTDPHGRLPDVELHWRLHWVESAFAQAALARSADGELERHDELLALLVFYARDGLQGLRYPADIVAWLDTFGAEIDFAQFESLLHRHPELAPAARAALSATRNAVGLPGGPVEQLVPRVLSRREALAVRMAAAFGPDDPDDLRATVALVNYLLAPWPVALRLVLRIVFAPRAGVEGRFPSPSTAMDRGLALSLRNVWTRLARQTRILLAVLRGSERRAGYDLTVGGR
jgi:hypothetical protein